MAMISTLMTLLVPVGANSLAAAERSQYPAVDHQALGESGLSPTARRINLALRSRARHGLKPTLLFEVNTWADSHYRDSRCAAHLPDQQASRADVQSSTDENDAVITADFPRDREPRLEKSDAVPASNGIGKQSER
jgi:hypothetical protein